MHTEMIISRDAIYELKGIEIPVPDACQAIRKACRNLNLTAWARIRLEHVDRVPDDSELQRVHSSDLLWRYLRRASVDVNGGADWAESGEYVNGNWTAGSFSLVYVEPQHELLPGLTLPKRRVEKCYEGLRFDRSEFVSLLKSITENLPNKLSESELVAWIHKHKDRFNIKTGWAELGRQFGGARRPSHTSFSALWNHEVGRKQGNPGKAKIDKSL